MNYKPILNFLRYALSVCLLLILLADVVTIHAMFPGTNGKIAFASDRDGDFEIYTMNPDGTDVTQLTNNTSPDRYPFWSPDGTKIAWASTEDGGDEDIWIMNADGTNKTQVTANNATDIYSTWSPDGTKLVFGSNQDGDYEIYVIQADGTGQIQLTNNSAEDAAPAWSPDGTKIAFQSTRDYPFWDIFVMDANGSNQTRLTFGGGQNVLVRWSPDGKIVWRRDQYSPTVPCTSSADIWIMNSDGTAKAPLVCGPGFDEPGSISPDNTKIMFASGIDHPLFEIYVMNYDGSLRTRLTTNTAHDIDADWQPLVNTFSGFFQPVDNLPTFNLVKAGQAIPVKFSLNGDQGLNIFAAGFPKSQKIDCESAVEETGIEVTLTAGSSSLSYDPSTDTYTYVWKTEKEWANTCRQLVIKLNDSSYHRANFKFK